MAVGDAVAGVDPTAAVGEVPVAPGDAVVAPGDAVVAGGEAVASGDAVAAVGEAAAVAAGAAPWVEAELELPPEPDDPAAGRAGSTTSM